MKHKKTNPERSVLLIRNQWANEIEGSIISETASSFEVPIHLAPVLQEKMEVNEGLRNYLRSLLNKFRLLNYSGELPKFRRLKTKYQDKGEKEEFSFRPFEADWAELKMLGLAHGVSATFFFVMLLHLDISEAGEDMDEFLKDVDPKELLAYPIELKLVLRRDSVPILTKHSKFGTDFYVFDPLRSS